MVDKEQRGAAQNVLSAAGSQNDALQEKSYFVLRDAKFHQPLVLDDQYAFVETSVDPVTNMVRTYPDFRCWGLWFIDASHHVHS